MNTVQYSVSASNGKVTLTDTAGSRFGLLAMPRKKVHPVFGGRSIWAAPAVCRSVSGNTYMTELWLSSGDVLAIEVALAGGA